MKKRRLCQILYFVTATILIVPMSFGGDVLANTADAEVPGDSTFFSTVYVEESDTLNTDSQGDLWASCWSDDDYLYAANGDGDGFTIIPPNTPNVPPAHEHLTDIAVNRISGTPGNLKGETIARSDDIGQIWNDPDHYNRKPTGMACVDGDLYLAVQDLSKDFNDVPSATIVKSTDKGKTWTWDKSGPMFDDHTFTTIMFLDYGKDYENAIDDYVYAYGLDYNWRILLTTGLRTRPNSFWLEYLKTEHHGPISMGFYAGLDDGHPTWSSHIDEKVPVLQDDRLVYQDTYFSSDPKNMTVISQGSVVYNKPLDRYIYSSWTQNIHLNFMKRRHLGGRGNAFYREKGSGAYPWTETKNGGYATTIPSKFISPDGKTMYVQSNTFMGGTNNYNFSLRKMVVEPYVSSTPTNSKNNDNLAVIDESTTPINKVAHFGNVDYFNNGIKEESEDSLEQRAENSGLVGVYVEQVVQYEHREIYDGEHVQRWRLVYRCKGTGQTKF